MPAWTGARVATDPVLADAESGLDRLLMKLRVRDLVSDEEERVLRGAVGEVKGFGAGRTIIRAGVTVSNCTLLIDGFIARYKDLADGQRQIMEVHVPGDFLDLHSFLLKRLEHNVGSLTPVRIALGAVMNLFVIPHPVWMQLSAVVAPLLGGVIANHLVRRRTDRPVAEVSDGAL